MQGIRSKMMGLTSKTNHQDLRPAITELGVSLRTMNTNEPINRKEGDRKQAELEARNAKSYTSAIQILKGAARK